MVPDGVGRSMGTNNRQRREAKRRKRRSGSRTGPTRATSQPPPDRGFADRVRVADALRHFISGSPGTGVKHGAVTDRARAEQLLAMSASTHLVAEELDVLVRELVAAVLCGGWTPSDLGEITRRRLTPRHVTALAAVLQAEADRYPHHRVATTWISDLSQLGRPEPFDPRTVDGLALGIGLAALMATLPSITLILPPPGRSNGAYQRPESGPQSRQLAKVRALLAKAESTQFAEEAELLSAKAQELISRYALGRIIDAGMHETDAPTITARRLWLDAPYILAKAMVVDVVAGANRCRSVISQDLGFCTIIGDVDDLDAVELLATSLLVQANAALLAHGRHADWEGRSRTKSFRRSFLIAYATRIGERLRSATEHAAAATGCSGELVPLLARRQRHVEEAYEQMFPHVLSKGATVTNGAGWVAGRAAADLARLDTTPEVSEQIG